MPTASPLSASAQTSRGVTLTQDQAARRRHATHGPAFGNKVCLLPSVEQPALAVAEQDEVIRIGLTLAGLGRRGSVGTASHSAQRLAPPAGSRGARPFAATRATPQRARAAGRRSRPARRR